MNVRREGFSLVEVVVALAVLAIVAAIALPAVNRAREAARQTTCLDNLRRLGAGVQQYQTTNKAFPRSAQQQVPDERRPRILRPDPAEAIKPTPGGQGTSWIVQNPAHIEQAALAQVLELQPERPRERPGGLRRDRRALLPVAADESSGVRLRERPAGRGGLDRRRKRSLRRVRWFRRRVRRQNPGHVRPEPGAGRRDGGRRRLVAVPIEDPLDAGIFGVNSRIRLEDIGDGARRRC